MLTERRRTQILQTIQNSGTVRTKDLALKFQVSEVTIRADLDELAARKQVERTHGGAMALNVDSPSAAFQTRMSKNSDAKQRIARAAAKLIGDNQTVVFDGGSTMMYLALQMPPVTNLVVATNSMNVAQQLMNRPGIELYMVGGKVDVATVSTTGGFGEGSFENFVAHKVFVGAHHIDSSLDVVDIVPDVAVTKRRLVDLGRQVILLADSSKWNTDGPVKAFPMSSVDIVIVDKNISKSVLEKLRQTSVEVILA